MGTNDLRVFYGFGRKGVGFGRKGEGGKIEKKKREYKVKNFSLVRREKRRV